MSARIVLLMVGALAASGCTRRVSAGSDSTPATTTVASAATPTLASLTPDAISMMGGAITEIVAKGTGFEPGQPGKNTVEVGTIVLTSVPANAAGTELRFVVPESYSTGTGMPMRTMSGSYKVVIRTSRGASNSVTLRVQ